MNLHGPSFMLVVAAVLQCTTTRKWSTFGQTNFQRQNRSFSINEHAELELMLAIDNVIPIELKGYSDSRSCVKKRSLLCQEKVSAELELMLAQDNVIPIELKGYSDSRSCAKKRSLLSECAD
jgi:hypothetical protein